MPEMSQFEAIMKVIAPLGVGGLLAAFMFLWYRRDMLDRILSMQLARETDQHLTKAVTAALERSTEAHERAIEESSQNRQLFLDLRTELILWRQSSGNRRAGEHG